jgi:hypothetical protein
MMNLMLRSKWIVAALKLLIFICIVCTGLSAGMSHSAFAAQRFDFTKYCETADMTNALRQLLPRGTSKAVVEEKLVEEGGATIHQDDQPRSNPNILHYFRPTSCDPENTQWWVEVTYDHHGMVRQIVAQGPPAFPQRPPDDRSDGSIFTFNDYQDAADLAQTLHTLFPLGTQKALIEKVLVQWAQAAPYAKVDEPHQVIYSYQFDLPATRENGVSHSHYGAWDVTASYDNENTLSGLFVAGPSVIQVFNQKEWHDYFRPKNQAYQKKKKEQHQ